MKRIFLVALLALSWTLARQAESEAKSTRRQLRPSATIHRRTIRLIPSGLTFTIPQSWLDWHREYGRTLFLKPKELEAAKDTIGEFKRSYAAVVNSVLPFERCAAHAGNDNWGKDAFGGSGSDLFMRVYVGPLNTQKIWQNIATTGQKKAAEFAQKGSSVSLAPLRRGKWQGSKMSYYLFYGDYGGTAHIEFFHQTIHNQPVVIVFMYSGSWMDQQKAIQQILSSFTWKSSHIGRKHR